jgi:transcriptional regulator with XRE-family HTH domain
MAIGERIRFFRNLKGMTQKYLGVKLGFPEKTADIRMAQYESGSRTPKEELTNELAELFGISASALNVPDIESYNGLMHTLFALEDLYGIKVSEINGEICLALDKDTGSNYITMFEMFSAWKDQAEKLKNGEISKEEMLAMKRKYDAKTADLVRRQQDAELRKIQKLDCHSLRASMQFYLTGILKGETESQVFCKSLLDSLTVFQDRHMELRLKYLPHIFHFT